MEELNDSEVNEGRIDVAALERILNLQPDGAAASHQSPATSEVKGENGPAHERPALRWEEVSERGGEVEPGPEVAVKPAMKAKIVDIPFARWEPPNSRNGGSGEGCRHERSDGSRCGREVWQNEMCGVHGEWYNTSAAAMGLPFPEDQLSFHRFLLKTMDMVVSGRIQARQAAAVEGMCKMIFKNIRTGEFRF